MPINIIFIAMKIKLTDVREVIGELITEAWAPHTHERKFKFPNAEEQERIQREFGIKIDFSNCIHDAEYLDTRWNQPTERGESLFYLMTGFILKEVHSTLDENYALALASINYENPFGQPQEYMAMAYGPLELMRQLQLTVNAQIYEVYPNDKGEGTDRVRKKISPLFETFLNIIYKNVWETANRRKLKVETKFKGKERIMIFGLPQDVQRVVQLAMKEIQERIKYHFQIVQMDPGIRMDVRGDEYLYYHIELYNKYTGMWVARLNIFDITFKWKDLQKLPSS